MLVDLKLDGVVVVGERPAVGVESQVSVCCGSHCKCLDIDGNDGQFGAVADV